MPCFHQQQTRSGSNQWQQRVTCLHCHGLRFLMYEDVDRALVRECFAAQQQRMPPEQQRMPPMTAAGTAAASSASRPENNPAEHSSGPEAEPEPRRIVTYRSVAVQTDGVLFLEYCLEVAGYPDGSLS